MFKRFVASVAVMLVSALWSNPVGAAALNLVHQEKVDVDGDGKHDIVLFDKTGGDGGTWYVLQGGTNFRTAFSVTWGIGTDEAMVADFNNGGRHDLAVYRDTGTDVGTWYILVGETNFSTAFSVGPWGIGSDEPVPGDYNGDTLTDLGVFRQVGTDAGTWYFLVGPTFTSAFSVTFGKPGDLPRPADYDGDGRLDLAVIGNLNNATPPTGDAGVWYILQGGTPPGSTGPYTRAYSVKWGNGSFSDVPLPGDYDSDGRIDLAVYRSFPSPGVTQVDNGNWYVLQGGTNYSTAFVVFWGKNTCNDCANPIPADYDNDTKLDLGFYSHVVGDAGTWYVLQGGVPPGAPGPFTRAFSVGPWGNIGDLAIAARVAQARYFGPIY